MTDTKVKSLIRGRLGAAVLALVAFLSVTFGVSPEDSQTATTITNSVFEWIIAGSTILSAVMAFFSKMRE